MAKTPRTRKTKYIPPTSSSESESESDDPLDTIDDVASPEALPTADPLDVIGIPSSPSPSPPPFYRTPARPPPTTGRRSRDMSSGSRWGGSRDSDRWGPTPAYRGSGSAKRRRVDLPRIDDGDMEEEKEEIEERLEYKAGSPMAPRRGPIGGPGLSLLSRLGPPPSQSYQSHRRDDFDDKPRNVSAARPYERRGHNNEEGESWRRNRSRLEVKNEEELEPEEEEEEVEERVEIRRGFSERSASIHSHRTTTSSNTRLPTHTSPTSRLGQAPPTSPRRMMVARAEPSGDSSAEWPDLPSTDEEDSRVLPLYMRLGQKVYTPEEVDDSRPPTPPIPDGILPLLLRDYRPLTPPIDREMGLPDNSDSRPETPPLPLEPGILPPLGDLRPMLETGAVPEAMVEVTDEEDDDGVGVGHIIAYCARVVDYPDSPPAVAGIAEEYADSQGGMVDDFASQENRSEQEEDTKHLAELESPLSAVTVAVTTAEVIAPLVTENDAITINEAITSAAQLTHDADIPSATVVEEQIEGAFGAGETPSSPLPIGSIVALIETSSVGGAGEDIDPTPAVDAAEVVEGGADVDVIPPDTAGAAVVAVITPSKDVEMEGIETSVGEGVTEAKDEEGVKDLQAAMEGEMEGVEEAGLVDDGAEKTRAEVVVSGTAPEPEGSVSEAVDPAPLSTASEPALPDTETPRPDPADADDTSAFVEIETTTESTIEAIPSTKPESARKVDEIGIVEPVAPVSADYPSPPETAPITSNGEDLPKDHTPPSVETALPTQSASPAAPKSALVEDVPSPRTDTSLITPIADVEPSSSITDASTANPVVQAVDVEMEIQPATSKPAVEEEGEEELDPVDREDGGDGEDGPGQIEVAEHESLGKRGESSDVTEVNTPVPVPTEPIIYNKDGSIRKKKGPKPGPKPEGWKKSHAKGQYTYEDGVATKKVLGKAEIKGMPGKKGKVEALKSAARGRSTSSPISDTPEITPPPIIKTVPASDRIVASAKDTGDEEEEEDEDEEVYCPCGKASRSDGNDVLVGCDGCDIWWHAGCVKLSEEDIDLVDTFYCSDCEKDTGRKTTLKLVCKRDGCEKQFSPKSTKFCSPNCAFRHSQVLVSGMQNKKQLKQLAASLAHYPSPPLDIRVIEHASSSSLRPVITMPETLDPADILDQRITAAQDLISILEKRVLILGKAADQCEGLAPLNPQNGDDVNGKKKRKVGGGEDKPCGWVEALIWPDEDVAAWESGMSLHKRGERAETNGDEVRAEGEGDGEDVQMGEEDVGGEVGYCVNPKKRCDRHSGWQKTIPALLETELQQMQESLDDLKTEKDHLVSSAEATRAGKVARENLHEMFAVNLSKNI